MLSLKSNFRLPAQYFNNCCLISPFNASKRRQLPVSLRNFARIYSSKVDLSSPSQQLIISGKSYEIDATTNVTKGVLAKVGKNLHNRKNHPLYLIRKRVENYFDVTFRRSGQRTPVFMTLDNLSPVVTTYQNFDSLLVPAGHPSRSPTDTYYINSEHLLRAHTSAHQEELIAMGSNAVLIVGDVYRRDEIDSTHYPVFHQMEGIRLFTENEVFAGIADTTGMKMFEEGKKTQEKQPCHTYDVAKILEFDLKRTLENLAVQLFRNGNERKQELKLRWVDCYFPFTHPSWELEVFHNGKWMETLGCGLMEQKILNKAGANSQIGWAFGLGLERLAMKLYDIPDIRLFWSEDKGFLSQFEVDDPETMIQYKSISQYPPCINDLSFWLPLSPGGSSYSSNDFYDLVRGVAGDLVEQVSLVDVFQHPTNAKTSHCYRIVYRHMEKTFSKAEVNDIHARIEAAATQKLGVEIRDKKR